MVKRSRIDIIHDTLSYLYGKRGGVGPTRILAKVNLSHKQLKFYLALLEEKQFILISLQGEKKRIKITKLGLAFLQKLNVMKEFENTFGL